MQKPKDQSEKMMDTTKEFSIDELNKALFDFEDVMERAMCPFLLLGQTAWDVKSGYMLTGDKVEVGIIKLCLTDMVKDTIKTYRGLDIDKENDKSFTYEVDKVPVVCKIIRNKYKFFKNPETVFYWGGDYQLPNPMVDYWKSRFVIK